MQTYKMIVKTQTADENGRSKTETEHIRFVPEAKLDRYCEVARTSVPIGATRTIRVVNEK